MSNLSKLQFNYRFYLFIGVIAAIIVGLGEYLLHFNPNGPAGEIDMLLHIPLERAKMGHFFSLVGIPLYFAGYWGLLKLFRSSNELFAKLLFIAGMFSFTIGGIWLSSRYYGAVVLQRMQETSSYEYFFSQYDETYQILVWALRLLILLVSIFYIINILKNKIGISKWFALLNPITILLFVFSTLAWARFIGIHIAPIAMNTTHLIFFLVLIFSSKDEKALEGPF